MQRNMKIQLTTNIKLTIRNNSKQTQTIANTNRMTKKNKRNHNHPNNNIKTQLETYRNPTTTKKYQANQNKYNNQKHMKPIKNEQHTKYKQQHNTN